MEDNILDDFSKKIPGKIYSVVSFIFSFLNLSLFITMVLMIPSQVSVEEGLKPPPLFLFYSFFFTVVLGFTCTVLSFAKQEANSFYKWIGCILNLLFSLLIIGSILLNSMNLQIGSSFGNSLFEHLVFHQNL